MTRIFSVHYTNTKFAITKIKNVITNKYLYLIPDTLNVSKIVVNYLNNYSGKVERSHRKDQERFYYNRIFISFEDFKKN